MVTSASPTTLKVTVPQAAQSGLISVTVSGNTATSAMSYTVRRPAITSFAPLAVNAGGTVTITGVNFNLVPGSTSVNIGGVIGFDHLDLEYTGHVRSRRGLDSRRHSGHHALRLGDERFGAHNRTERARRGEHSFDGRSFGERLTSGRHRRCGQ